MKPYELLSRIYDEGWGGFSAGYIPFLEFLRERHGISMRRVLDLACGTGSLALSVARGAERVVGIDLSPEMIELARGKASGLHNVEFRVADFRSFDLDETFSLILCTFDSLNYIKHTGELAEVFQNTSRHLEPGGHFVFDVVNERHMLACDDFSGSFDLSGARYDHVSRYDPERKVNTVTFDFAEGREVHRQIPIEYGEMPDAAEAAGLLLKEAFSGPKGEPVGPKSRRFFTVLYKPKVSRSAP